MSSKRSEEYVSEELKQKFAEEGIKQILTQIKKE